MPRSRIYLCNWGRTMYNHIRKTVTAALATAVLVALGSGPAMAARSSYGAQVYNPVTFPTPRTDTKRRPQGLSGNPRCRPVMGSASLQGLLCFPRSGEIAGTWMAFG